MKLQLSEKRIIPDAITVWQEPGPEVDIVMDVRNLTFGQGSVEELHVFHVLEHLFPKEVLPALVSWKNCLKSEAKIITIVDNFESIARDYIGAGISIHELNSFFSTPTRFDHESLFNLFLKAGFKEGDIIKWNHSTENGFYKMQEHELIFSSKNNG